MGVLKDFNEKGVVNIESNFKPSRILKIVGILGHHRVNNELFLLVRFNQDKYLKK